MSILGRIDNVVMIITGFSGIATQCLHLYQTM